MSNKFVNSLTVHKSIIAKLANGVFWSAISAITAQGVMLISNYFLVRWLTIVQYGEFAVLRSTISMFSLFAGLGLGLTTTKFISQYKHSDKDKVAKIILIATYFTLSSALLIVILLFFFSGYVSKDILNAPHLSGEVRFTAIIIFFSAMAGLYNGSLVGFEAFKTIAIVNFVAAVLFFASLTILTKLYQLNGALLGLGLFYFLSFLLSFLAVRKIKKRYNIPIKTDKIGSQFSVIYKFTLPAFLSGIMITPVLWGCNALLVNQNNGYGQMAIFDVANQWRLVALFIPGVISQVALPLFAKTVDNQSFYKILRINILLAFVFSLLTALVMSIFADFIMNFYGKNFAAGSMILIVLAVSTILSSVNSVIGQAIVGKGFMWQGFMLNFLWALSIIGFSYYFASLQEGAIGYAKSFLYSYLIHTLLQMAFVKIWLLPKPQISIK